MRRQGNFAGPDAYSQAAQILRHFRTMLAAAGSDMDHVLHVNVFLKRVEDFQEMNRAYREAFPGSCPRARWSRWRTCRRRARS
jgi:2-iminobutanoate/2-iminopropanoate deaminase